jgi:hypothetical protein
LQIEIACKVLRPGTIRRAYIKAMRKRGDPWILNPESVIAKNLGWFAGMNGLFVVTKVGSSELGQRGVRGERGVVSWVKIA